MHYKNTENIKMKTLSKSISILGITLISCTSMFAQKSDQQYIRDFARDYAKMYTEMDFSNVKEYYNDSIRIMPEFQKTIQSQANAEKYYNAFFNRFKIKSYTRNINEIIDLDSRFMEIEVKIQ